ncbi:hypothetical protein [Natronolimnobius baerhuensis]|uniref:Uncharacterized protein n=1 Tax=Natronolimnobius baerhuensis TaxID=253108 RepID=A0A202E933_9EURY|nr:hypothetical protein [Natronolimnobius baerhuensis]OVE84719.1 hypothetical protein B2G88_10060 [Natronolimnobius baerhuensis]
MSNQPPSPPSPSGPSPAMPSEPTTDTDEQVLVTTTQLEAALESHLSVSLGSDTLETVLVELDRAGYVEWIAITDTGDYVWDLADSPEQISEAIATGIANRLEGWVRSQLR